jgi:DNA-binding NtrC family response regulator
LEDARNLSRILESVPVEVDHVRTLQQARKRIQEKDYEAILTEARLPDGHWRDALRLARECSHEVEVVVTDPQADGRFWEEAMGSGAYDLLAQPFYAPEVCRILSGACSHRGRPTLRAAG